jgi:hypothetical protein
LQYAAVVGHAVHTGRVGERTDNSNLTSATALLCVDICRQCRWTLVTASCSREIPVIGSRLSIQLILILAYLYGNAYY